MVMNFFSNKSMVCSLCAIDSSRGFTLIELLVVTTLLVFVMGGSIAGYRRFNDRQQVITAGKELLVALRQAQSKASSGVKSLASCQTVPLVGYKITVLAASQDTYTIAESYQSNCVSATSADNVIKTVKLPQGVRFQSAFTATFTGLSGGVIYSGASPLTLRVCNASCGTGSLQYTITVNSAGLVQDMGAQ